MARESLWRNIDVSRVDSLERRGIPMSENYRGITNVGIIPQLVKYCGISYGVNDSRYSFP